MLFFYECFQSEKRQHQPLLNLFTSVKHLIVFNKTNLPKSGKMSFCFTFEGTVEGREHFSVCVCVIMRVFTQLEGDGGITSPGGSSWGVCRDPLKRLWHPLSKQEDFTYQNITALQLKKKAKPYRPLLNILRGTNVSH